MKIKKSLNDCNLQPTYTTNQWRKSELKKMNQPLETPLTLVLLVGPSILEDETGRPSIFCECSPCLDPMRFGAALFLPTLESIRTSLEMLFSLFGSQTPFLDGIIVQLIKASQTAPWVVIELILFKETFFLASLISGNHAFFLFTKLYLEGDDDGVVGISRLSCVGSDGKLVVEMWESGRLEMAC